MLSFKKDVLNIKVKNSEIHIDKLKKKKKEKPEKYLAGSVKKKQWKKPLDLFLSSKLPLKGLRNLSHSCQCKYVTVMFEY